MRPPLFLLLATASAVLSMAACGGGGASDTPAQAPPTTTQAETQPAASVSATRYSVESAGFSIEVPKSWKALEADQALKTAEFEQFIEDNPDLETYRDVFEDPNSAFKFVALDPNVTNEFATNVNVVVTSVPASVTPEQYGSALSSEIASLSNVEGEVSHESASLPAGAAEKLDYAMKFDYGGVERTVAALQYGLLIEGRSYVLTFTTLPELKDEYAGRFAEIARSLQVQRT